MNRLILSLCVLAALVNLAGCKPEGPAYTVVLVDVSKSITPDGVKYEFKVADDLVDKMHRGDRLIIIPITGNALTDTPGHILRLIAPTERQAYDYDLKAFRQKAHEQIVSMREAALAHPSLRTDILGTLDVATEKLKADAATGRLQRHQALIILSDFIEDEDAYRFAFDPAMDSIIDARAFAGRLQKDTHLALGGVRVHFSTIESSDLRRLTQKRQKAIVAFWSAYLSASQGTMYSHQELRRRTPLDLRDTPVL